MSFWSRRILLTVAAALLFVGCGAAEPGVEEAGSVPAAAEDRSEVTVAYLFRHAEKRNDQGEDPELTPAGLTRAEALAERMADVGIDAIYATQYRRTQLTVEPLAERLALDVEIVDAGAVAELAQKILDQHRGQAVLVCAHSNTVPVLARELGSPEEITIPDDRYGDLFVLRAGAETVALERQRVGE